MTSNQYTPIYRLTFSTSDPNDRIPRSDLDVAKNITRHHPGSIYANGYDITKDKLTGAFKKMCRNVKNIALDSVPFVPCKDGYIKRADYGTMDEEEKRIMIDKILDHEPALREFHGPWPIAIIVRNVLRSFNQNHREDREICTKRVWHDFYPALPYPHEPGGKLYWASLFCLKQY
jgi:hypothetical protein